MCCYHRVLQEFWLLHVAIKDILGLNCIPEHAQNECLILVWAGRECIWQWPVREVQSKGAISNSGVVISVGGMLLLQDKSLM